MLQFRGKQIARNSSDDPEEFRATLGEHLEELRGRLFKVILLLVVGMTIGWFLEPVVYEKLAALVREFMPKEMEYKEAFRNVTEPFMLKLKMSFYLGLILTLPFCVLQLWGFIAPGLKASEKKPLKVVAPLSVFLFLLGAFFCWLIIPSAFAWFIGYIKEFPGTAVFQEPGTMVFFILKMLLAFGIGFQLPLVVFFLAKIGILTPESIRHYWKQATVGIFFGSAILTPSQDIFSMLMMAIPMTVLFFLSMAAVRITGNKERAAELDALD